MTEETADEIPQEVLALDACCVINLSATRRMGEILGAVGHRCVVPAYVAHEEALGLGRDGEDADDREPIDLSPLVNAAHLEIREMTNAEERREFVRFAVDLDDGEAWTCALAKLENGIVATDDRKTLRLLDKEGIPTLQTPEILHSWAKHCAVPSAQVREALERVERFATFRPRRQAPFFEWWREHIDG